MKFTLLTLIAALALGSFSAHAAEPRKKPDAAAAPAAEKKTPRSANGRALPYRAKVATVDAQAATFSSAGKAGTTNLFAVTEKTTITKDGKPAAFADLTVGSIVTGVRTRTPDGKWEVGSVNILSLDAMPKTRSAKKEAIKPPEKKPDDTKPAEKTEAASAPTDAPKSVDSAKPEEPKADAKPEEKKAE